MLGMSCVPVRHTEITRCLGSNVRKHNDFFLPKYLAQNNSLFSRPTNRPRWIQCKVIIRCTWYVSKSSVEEGKYPGENVQAQDGKQEGDWWQCHFLSFFSHFSGNVTQTNAYVHTVLRTSSALLQAYARMNKPRTWAYDFWICVSFYCCYNVLSSIQGLLMKYPSIYWIKGVVVSLERYASSPCVFCVAFGGIPPDLSTYTRLDYGIAE